MTNNHYENSNDWAAKINAEREANIKRSLAAMSFDEAINEAAKRDEYEPVGRKAVYINWVCDHHPERKIR